MMEARAVNYPDQKARRTGRIGAKINFNQASKLLVYDAKSGKIFWKRRPLFMFRSGSAHQQWNDIYAGKEAFASPSADGYVRGGVLNKVYLAHRIAWLLYYKEWPRGRLIHRNRKKSDNRISNLRDMGAKGVRK